MSWPTTDEPRIVFVTVRLTVPEAADLDAYASATSKPSRSAAVRHAVEREIDREKKRAARSRESQG